MHERTLLLTSAIAVAIGIPLLIVISIITANSLDNPENFLLEEDPEVFITGKVLKISKSPSITRITLQYQATMPIIIFEDNEIRQGDYIKIRGKLEKYKGKKQVRATSVKLL